MLRRSCSPTWHFAASAAPIRWKALSPARSFPASRSAPSTARFRPRVEPACFWVAKLPGWGNGAVDAPYCSVQALHSNAEGPQHDWIQRAGFVPGRLRRSGGAAVSSASTSAAKMIYAASTSVPSLPSRSFRQERHHSAEPGRHRRPQGSQQPAAWRLHHTGSGGADRVSRRRCQPGHESGIPVHDRRAGRLSAVCGCGHESHHPRFAVAHQSRAARRHQQHNLRMSRA